MKYLAVSGGQDSMIEQKGRDMYTLNGKSPSNHKDKIIQKHRHPHEVAVRT